MSNLVVSDLGIAEALSQWSNGSGITADSWYARLSITDITPTKATVLGDVVEASFPGYAGIQLSALGSWPAPTVASHIATSLFDTDIVWTQTAPAAPQLVYLVYFTDAGNSILYASARMTGVPFTMSLAGDSITENPTLRVTSEFG